MMASMTFNFVIYRNQSHFKFMRESWQPLNSYRIYSHLLQHIAKSVPHQTEVPK